MVQIVNPLVVEVLRPPLLLVQPLFSRLDPLTCLRLLIQSQEFLLAQLQLILCLNDDRQAVRRLEFVPHALILLLQLFDTIDTSEGLLVLFLALVAADPFSLQAVGSLLLDFLNLHLHRLHKSLELILQILVLVLHAVHAVRSLIANFNR